MKKVQVIGLPCSGKTTAITSYISKIGGIQHLDIRSFNGPNRFHKYRKAVLKSRTNLIAESASGIVIPNTYVIRLDIDKSLLYKRTLEREGKLDEFYLSLIEEQMIKPQYTARSVRALHAIFDVLFLGVQTNGNAL